MTKNTKSNRIRRLVASATLSAAFAAAFAAAGPASADTAPTGIDVISFELANYDLRT